MFSKNGIGGIVGMFNDIPSGIYSEIKAIIKDDIVNFLVLAKILFRKTASLLSVSSLSGFGIVSFTVSPSNGMSI